MIVHATPRSSARRPPAGVRHRFYPPPRYLDLVRLRLSAAIGGGISVSAGLPPSAGGDAALVALAVELTGLAELDALPHSAKRHILGLNVAEVRAYLRQVAREAGVDD